MNEMQDLHKAAHADIRGFISTCAWMLPSVPSNLRPCKLLGRRATALWPYSAHPLYPSLHWAQHRGDIAACAGRKMANSKYEYVKGYEQEDRLLPGCFIVVRIDGKGFTKFCETHSFEKPNDKRALDLMDAAAKAVMTEFADVRLAYGESDEYSFILHRKAALYDRRSSKIVSLFASCFTANYIRLWNDYMTGTPLQATPLFDARTVCYPDEATLRDYLTWRQVDTHINNQYNTCFWALIQQAGQTPTEAQASLKGTDTAAKNELLFSRFGINYSSLPQQFRKGTTLVREKKLHQVKLKEDGTPVMREKWEISTLYEDIIKDKPFWTDRPDLLS